MKTSPLSMQLGEDTQLMMLDPNLLEVDPTYQRDLYDRWVEETILENFNWHVFGVLTVALRLIRGVIHYFLVDGQQRNAAAKKRGEKLVPCFTFESKGVRHEAEVYRKVNEFKKRMTAIEIWKSRVAARDRDAMKILEILDRHGLKVVKPGKKSCKWNEIGAIRAMVGCYESLGAARFQEMIDVLVYGFESNDETVSDEMLLGMKKLFEVCYDVLDQEELIRRLRTTTPIRISDRANRASSRDRCRAGRQRYHYIFLEMVSTYNRNRSKGKLPLHRSKIKVAVA